MHGRSKAQAVATDWGWRFAELNTHANAMSCPGITYSTDRVGTHVKSCYLKLATRLLRHITLLML
jgi:hypothetical protein